MTIRINLDVMMAKRKIGVGELAEQIGITPANVSILKNGRAKAVRFTTLDAICKALDCQPGDIRHRLELMVQLVVSPKINDALSSCKTIGHHHVIMHS